MEFESKWFLADLSIAFFKVFSSMAWIELGKIVKLHWCVITLETFLLVFIHFTSDHGSMDHARLRLSSPCPTLFQVEICSIAISNFTCPEALQLFDNPKPNIIEIFQ